MPMTILRGFDDRNGLYKDYGAACAVYTYYYLCSALLIISITQLWSFNPTFCTYHVTLPLRLLIWCALALRRDLRIKPV